MDIKRKGIEIRIYDSLMIPLNILFILRKIREEKFYMTLLIKK